MGGTPQCRSSFNLQREVFDRILIRCADLGGRIMSIHSRQAGKEVLNALENHPQSGKAVLHWFSGSKRELERAIELGTWFSVGPITCGVFGALCVKSVRFMTLIEAPRFLNVLTKGIS
jgi:TatD DNase family protein